LIWKLIWNRNQLLQNYLRSKSEYKRFQITISNQLITHLTQHCVPLISKRQITCGNVYVCDRAVWHLCTWQHSSAMKTLYLTCWTKAQTQTASHWEARHRCTTLPEPASQTSWNYCLIMALISTPSLRYELTDCFLRMSVSLNSHARMVSSTNRTFN